MRSIRPRWLAALVLGVLLIPNTGCVLLGNLNASWSILSAVLQFASVLAPAATTATSG